jgi:hypothetical protein
MHTNKLTFGALAAMAVGLIHCSSEITTTTKTIRTTIERRERRTLDT